MLGRAAGAAAGRPGTALWQRGIGSTAALDPALLVSAGEPLAAAHRRRHPWPCTVPAAACQPHPPPLLSPPHPQDELRSIVGDRLTTAAAAREQHGKDESFHRPVPPQAVVFPESTAEVSRIVRAAAAARTPVIPFGAGTSLEGHVAALAGGVSLDMSRMNRVLSVRSVIKPHLLALLSALPSAGKRWQHPTATAMHPPRSLQVSQEDMDCWVQAGVTRKQLDEHLRDTGL